MSAQSDFIALMTPWAVSASQQTGIDANLIMAQWGIETGWGTSYQWKTNYNPAGIGITSDAVQGQNYGGIAGGVQAYINFVNNNSRYQAVKSAVGAQAQAIAMGNSGWAASGYNDGGGPGSSLLSTMNSLGVNVDTGQPMPANAFASSASAASSAAGAASSAGTGGGGGGGDGAASSNSAPAVAANTATTDILGTSYTGTSTNISALSQMEATLAAYGFSGQDLKTVVNWAWGEITNNTDPSQIAIDIQTPGSPVYSVFQKQFPGFTDANNKLLAQGLPAVSVSQYQQYETNAFAAAQAAGLPPGMLNKNNIGTLIGNNVSSAELTSRLNDAVALAYQSTPEQQAMFNQYFGVQDQGSPIAATPGRFAGGNIGNSPHGPLTPGQIAALALDPKLAEPLIHQQITAAQIGGAGVTAGIGAISQTEASKLAQAGISNSQATSQFAQIGQLGALETALPGQVTGGANQVISADTLAEGNLLGTGKDVRAQQVAQESRRAPFAGGGGLVSTGTGVVGAGSATQKGSPGTQ